MHKSVDILINDAGISSNPAGLPPNTEDGFERVFQVNYLGPFLLTQLLLPALRASESARVIDVASSASYMSCAFYLNYHDCLASPEKWEQDATKAEGDQATLKRGGNGAFGSLILDPAKQRIIHAVPAQQITGVDDGPTTRWKGYSWGGQKHHARGQKHHAGVHTIRIHGSPGGLSYQIPNNKNTG